MEDKGGDTMKKEIAVIALDPFAGRAYADQIREVFGSAASVRNYSVMDKTAFRIAPCDLCMVSTDAFNAMNEPGRPPFRPEQRMEIQVTYRKEIIRRLNELPRGSRVLFVNVTETMAREAVAQLEQLGVGHLKFLLYAPGMPLPDAPEIVVTPDEMRYVPETSAPVINIGPRTCSADTMIEAAMRLGLEAILEQEAFKRYQEEVCTNTYSFERMMDRSRRLESQFDILMEVLEQGVIAVNEDGQITAINEAAREMTHVYGAHALKQPGETVFPYIPFMRSIYEKQATKPEVLRIAGSLVSLCVRPVLREKKCIGAFAILQKFNEVESRQNELRGQLLKKGGAPRAKYCFDDVIGQSPALIETKELLKKMAKTDSPILLIGETGTGKELLAHSVHNASSRRNQPFIAINCGAMPDNLLESELFGYEDGAFTGARKGGRPGLFEFAHQGSLFLDEVEGMSPALQVKLLRVLQEHEIMRIGGSQIIHVDVRIIAATNEALERRVQDGSFRRDLYYRLTALPVQIPPLKDRGNDVFLLLDSFCNELECSFSLEEETRELFRLYPWPGNIRELHNVVEYLNFLEKPVITPSDLPPTFHFNREDGIRATSTHNKLTASGRSAVSQIRESSYVAPEYMILKILFSALRSGRRIGREGILKEASSQGLCLSQHQLRTILSMLEKEGLITINRGRGGSVITEAGIQRLNEAYF